VKRTKVLYGFLHRATSAISVIPLHPLLFETERAGAVVEVIIFRSACINFLIRELSPICLKCPFLTFNYFPIFRVILDIDLGKVMFWLLDLEARCLNLATISMLCFLWRVGF